MSAPQQPMLARRQLRLAAIACLNGIKTAAQIATIDSPGDWNTPPEVMPAVLIRTPADRKMGVVKGMAEFTTTVTLEIEARLEATTETAAQDQIEALCYAIENALFTDYNVIGMIQQVSSVDTQTEITATGARHTGAIKMSISVEMFEAYDPMVAAPAASTWPVQPPATVPLTSVGLHADLAGTYDPSGTYTPSADAPAYTPVPAPRTTGPDGRDEGSLDITLPQ